MTRQLKQVTLANELSAIRQEIKERKEAIKPLEDRDEEIAAQLLETLKAQGVQHVKLDSGVTFVRAHRTTLKVTDESQAIAWAEVNNALKVDTTKAAKILKLTGKFNTLPEGFERQDTEYLSVRSATSQEGE